jgi:hypothetical protein
MSPQVIAKALGHSAVTMWERYARPPEEAMKSIIDALREMVPAGGGGA